MSSKNELSRITIDIPKTYHKRLKAKAALLGKSMRQIIIESIENHLCENIPNKETIQAIKDVEKGKNLIEAEDLEDLFNKLGI